MEQIDKGYTFPLLKQPSKTKIYDNYSLLENFDIYKFNKLGYQSMSVALWLGSNHKTILFNLPALETVEKYETLINTKYANLKVHQPL